MKSRKFRREYKDPKTGSAKKAWPSLFDAIEEQNWKKAADESKRGQVGDRRNKAIFNLLMDAHHQMNP